MQSQFVRQQWSQLWQVGRSGVIGRMEEESRAEWRDSFYVEGRSDFKLSIYVEWLPNDETVKGRSDPRVEWLLNDEK